MKLNEFISQSLIEIGQGIIEAQKEYAEFEGMGGQVNPRGMTYSNPDLIAGQHKATSRIAQTVEFDLMVADASESGKSGKAGIEVLGQGISGNASQVKNEESVNRIRFKIPVVFPKSDYKEEQL